ncbi:class IV lanthionine synthetase LanL [Actinoallomurus sp. NPDC052274]|uniref:class IV lanthionine synthetase LanL n=1 Tax=Actinoallomurus sp. NPDC052274 TaxID=3155420 RepID=UPI00341517EF
MGYQEPVDQVVRRYAGADHTVTSGPVWLVVRPNGAVLPEHGWKLHISSRSADYPALVETLLPLLVAEGCVFKLARSQQVLDELNDGRTAPASVGKAFTVYPDQKRVRELGTHLARTLRGHPGPRVLSDRRVRADAPVYYRYGPFAVRWSDDARGRPVNLLYGPDGEEFDALAGLGYRQPSWVTDPFTGRAGGAVPDGGDVLLGGRYRVVGGIREAAQGNVYRAIDGRESRPVVVKQARALIAEHGDRNDSRLRLRNERRVLEVLDGVAGVPRFIDHFRHGDDEFLVTTDCGPRSLDDDVRRDGPYETGPGTGARRLDRLAVDLARILLRVHERGVIMRDLTPANVVVGGEVAVVDFGLAAYDGLHLPGKTPGYAPARQIRNEPPRDTDDLHALGMTLAFAATGLHPVALGEDPGLPRTRALQTLSRHHGRTPCGIIAAIADLLGDDDRRARAAARRIASEDTDRRPAGPLPAFPAVTEETAAEVAHGLVRDLVGRLSDVLDAPDTTQAARDVSVYSGSAGIGLELLHHLAYPPAAARARELVAFTARVAGRRNLPPGLFTGVTGTAVFLQEAADRGIGADERPGRSLPSPDWRPDTPDLIDGTAGVGLGHLYLYRAGGDPADLEVALRCAREVAADRPPASGSAPGEADLAAGRAHGLAGTAELLLRVAEETGETPMLELAAGRVRRLAERARSLIPEAKNRAAEELTVSWCRGLSGIGRTLLHASAVLGDASLADLARQAADACILRVPRLSAPGRCCGAAGVGGYLLDVAVLEQSARYWDAARDVGTHLLLRNAGSPEHPRFFAAGAPPDRALSWAHGLTGILMFFRRLAHGGAEGPQALR